MKKPFVSVIIPCLNEARSVGVCVRKARKALAGAGMKGEVLVVDNGSTDGSAGLARKAGARVVPCVLRGYGAALRKGIETAKGGYLIMGDADDTYDFNDIPKLTALLDQGADLAMGSRLRGRIAPGAMPPLHRYVGTPFLTGILNLFFGSKISDANCGMRGFTKEAAARMNLTSNGMEFASEMVVKAAQKRMKILEVPLDYGATPKDRVPKLNTMRDGWRHLRFMLLLAPRYLFVYSGLILTVLGLALSFILLRQSVTLFHVPLGLSAAVFANALMFIGIQVALFGVCSIAFNGARGEAGGDEGIHRWLGRYFTLNRGLIVSCLVILAGLGMGGLAVSRLLEVSFQGGEVNVQVTKLSVAAIFATLLGIQLFFSSFYLSLFELVEGAKEK